jgi:hypothetical protein
MSSKTTTPNATATNAKPKQAKTNGRTATKQANPKPKPTVKNPLFDNSSDSDNEEIIQISTKARTSSSKKLHELSVKGLLEFIQEKADYNVGRSETGFSKLFKDFKENRNIILGKKYGLIMDKCKEMINKCYVNYGKKYLKQYLAKNNNKLNSGLFRLIGESMWNNHLTKSNSNYADYEDKIMDIINANIEVVEVVKVEEIEADESDLALLDDSDSDTD